MVIEAPKRKIIYIGNEPPDNSPQYSGWIDTASRTIKTFVNGQWVVQADLADPVPSGLSTTVKIANKILTFTNGVLTNIENV